MSNYILVINPGSTSTKIGVFENGTLLFDKTLRHPAEEIAKFATIPDQKEWRKELVEQALTENNFDMKKLTAICARGGLVKPIRGGTYATSDALLADCVAGVQGQHACNLGGLIAREIGDELGVPSFIADPPVVDEMQAIARYSGHPLIPRVSKFHALNQKAVAKRYAKEVGKKYEDLNLIVCHMGGGHSTDLLADLIVEGVDDLGYLDIGLGHLQQVAHIGAAGIGHQTAAMHGQVDQIILTGGIAYGKETVQALKDMVEWIAPVTVYPGEDELLALAQAALRVLRDEEEARKY